ncbi:MAG: hypothetical protein ACJA0O_001162 [Porticoccus sp.]|jgi:hypothetical protein
MHSNRMPSGSKKRRSSLALLFPTGDAKRYIEVVSQPIIHSLGVQLLTELQEITSNLLSLLPRCTLRDCQG